MPMDGEKKLFVELLVRAPLSRGTNTQLSPNPKPLQHPNEPTHWIKYGTPAERITAAAVQMGDTKYNQTLDVLLHCLNIDLMLAWLK